MNLPVALMGVALIVLGALTVSERNFLEALNLGSTSLYVGIASAMILSGIVLLVLAVGGTVAAFREHRPSLIVYYAVAAVVFLLLCIVVMLGFVYRMKVKGKSDGQNLVIFSKKIKLLLRNVMLLDHIL